MPSTLGAALCTAVAVLVALCAFVAGLAALDHSAAPASRPGHVTFAGSLRAERPADYATTPALPVAPQRASIR